MKILLLLLLTFCGWTSIGADFSPPYVRDNYNPPFVKRSAEEGSEESAEGCLSSCIDKGNEEQNCIRKCGFGKRSVEDGIYAKYDCRMRCHKDKDPISRPLYACLDICGSYDKRSVEEGSDDDTCMADCKKKGLSWNVCIRGCPKPGKRSVEEASENLSCMDSCRMTRTSTNECAQHCGNGKRSVEEGSEAANDNCKRKCKDDGKSEDTCQRECFGSPGKRSVKENDCVEHCISDSGLPGFLCNHFCRHAKRSVEEASQGCMDSCSRTFTSWNECANRCGHGKRSVEEGSKGCRLDCLDMGYDEEFCEVVCPLRGKRSSEGLPMTWRILYEKRCIKRCQNKGFSEEACTEKCRLKRSVDEGSDVNDCIFDCETNNGGTYANCVRYCSPPGKRSVEDLYTVCIGRCYNDVKKVDIDACERRCGRGQRSVEEGSEESKKNQQ